jgi:hypothetical protein
MSYYQKTVEETKTRRKSSNFFELVKDIPFWHWIPDKEHEELRHRFNGYCCINHVFGLPEKPAGVKHPIYQWQKEVYDAIYQDVSYDPIKNKLTVKKQDSRYFMILKSRSVGGTSLLSRLLIWDCSRNSELKDTDAIVITGNRLEMSIDIIRRLKRLIANTGVELKPTRETLLEFHDTRISALPSKALSSLRGYEKVSWIIADEADYWTASEGQQLRATVEPFQAKSNPVCCLLSTPRAMWGLFWQLEQEKNSLYKKLYIPYNKALGTIFSFSEIAEAKKSPSFEREFNLSYTAGIEGAAFREEDIDNAIKLGEAMGDPTTLDRNILQLDNPMAREVKVCSVDPAYGSSSYGISILGIRSGYIETLYSDEMTRPDFNQAISKTLYLYKFYDCRCILVDAANVSTIAKLKLEVGDPYPQNYMEHITQLRAQWNVKDPMELKHFMTIIPVSWSHGVGRDLLAHAQLCLSQGGIAVHPCHEKLIYFLRSAVVKPETQQLNKQETQFDDMGESWILGLKFFKSERRQ